MEYISVILIFIFSILAGFIGSLTGLGGGTILTPLLTIFLNFPLIYSMGLSLLSTISTSISSSVSYIKEKIANDNIAISLLTATTLGAIIGSLTNNFLYSHHLFFIVYIIFGIVLIASSLFLIIKNLKKEYEPSKPDKTTFIFNLFGKYKEKDKIIYYDGTKFQFGWIIMFFAGFISGLLGIGSGILKVLGMDLIMNLPIKVSTTTSNFMIGVTADTSSVLYYKFGYILFSLIPFTILGVLIGARIGTRLLLKLNDRVIRTIFVFFVSYLGFKMMFDGLKIDGYALPVVLSFVIVIISYILSKIKIRESKEKIDISKYVIENKNYERYSLLLNNFERYSFYILIILCIISIISYIFSFYLIDYILYLFLILIPFSEIIIEEVKFAKEENKLYTLLASIILINLMIGMIFLPIIL